MADELYAASPDDFVERRTQRVAEARAARERPLAKAISLLRRPTRSAWMVNLLARESSAEVAALLDLGAALAEAQQRANGADLRRLSWQRHATLEALSRRATELAAAAGHVATEASRREVTATLQAALADPTVAELVRAGRVTQPVTYAGFGPLDVFAAATPGVAAGRPEPEAVPEAPAAAAELIEPPQPGDRQPAEDPARRAAEAAVHQATEDLEAAEEEASQAARDAEQATAQADELADQVEGVREQLAQAESDERQARDLARAARRRAQQLSRTAVEAQRALAEAQEALAGLRLPR